jgi:DNA-binding MarR family transcriptional regulator
MNRTNDDPDWDDVSYVISSQYRVVVTRALADGPSTPSQIAINTDQSIGNISRALQELRERSMVKLLVSESRRKGRVYGITGHGERVWEKIVSEGLV